MDRKQFISLVGMSAGGFILASCLGGCKKKTPDTKVTVDFTLDLSESANGALANNGGYLVSNGVIVAKTTNGAFVAVSAACTHEGATLIYYSPGNEFHCTRHGANFSTAGSVLNGPASTALQQFNTTLTGTMLRVYS
jgi:cytochrome b6-f complex iron-sulfur subunit